MVALLTSVRNSPCFGGLRRTKTCHRQLFARPSTCFLVTFCTMQKVTIRSLCREHRGSANLESARRKGGFALTKLNPLPLRGLSAALGGILSAAKPPLKLSYGKFCPCRDGTLRVLFGGFPLRRKPPSTHQIPYSNKTIILQRRFYHGKHLLPKRLRPQQTQR